MLASEIMKMEVRPCNAANGPNFHRREPARSAREGHDDTLDRRLIGAAGAALHSPSFLATRREIQGQQSLDDRGAGPSCGVEKVQHDGNGVT
jgi:hypothetical protein